MNIYRSLPITSKLNWMKSYQNNASDTSTDGNDHADLFVTYYPLAVIIVGTILNSFTFAILCRSTFRDTNRRPTLHYMRAIAIFDILMLYGWNFDHYLHGAHHFMLQTASIPTCKFFSFLNYFAAQVSAWLRVFICLDRYLTLSRLHKTWFSRSKSVLIIIASIMTVFTLINLHIIIFACYYRANGTIEVRSAVYTLYPLWDHVNLGLYNGAPFICMTILNSGVIYYLLRYRQTSTIQQSRLQHRSISITLVITTFLFLIMTTPATVGFAFFFETAGYVLLRVFDSMLYTYHILSFPLYMITFTEFREVVISLVKCDRHGRVGVIGFR